MEASFGRPSLLMRAALVAFMIVAGAMLLLIMIPLMLVGAIAFLVLGTREALRRLFRPGPRSTSLEGRKNVRVIRRD